MFDVIKKYQHHDIVITVVETTDAAFAREVFENYQIDASDTLESSSHYYIVSSGPSDQPKANGIWVYTSKEAALNSAQDEFILWKQWDAPETDIDFEGAFDPC